MASAADPSNAAAANIFNEDEDLLDEDDDDESSDHDEDDSASSAAVAVDRPPPSMSTAQVTIAVPGVPDPHLRQQQQQQNQQETIITKKPIQPDESSKIVQRFLVWIDEADIDFLQGSLQVSCRKPAKNDWVISRVFQKTSGGKKVHISGLMRMNSVGNELAPSALPPLMDPSPYGGRTKPGSILDKLFGENRNLMSLLNPEINNRSLTLRAKSNSHLPNNIFHCDSLGSPNMGQLLYETALDVPKIPSCKFSYPDFILEASGDNWRRMYVVKSEINNSETLRAESHSHQQSDSRFFRLVRLVVNVKLWVDRAKKRVLALEGLRGHKKQKIVGDLNLLADTASEVG